MSAFANPAGVRRIFKTAGSLLRPPPNLKPSEWAPKHIHIPQGNARPGLIDFDNAPYQPEPLDCMLDPRVERVTLMWGAQVGKTQTALAAQAFCISMSPRSQIMMQPSQGDLNIWLETKFNPLVSSSPAIRKRLAKPRGRNGVNNSRMKSYPGGFMMYAWAGSPKTARGRSAPFIVADEVDGYAVTEEGHPVSLLWQRAATFGDQRKLVEISTPTIKGESYIEKAFLAGDQRRYHIRCPHCREEQFLRWDNVTWRGKRDSHEANLANLDDHEPDSARYACMHCGGLIDDGQRIAAIRKGRWIASKPFKGHASFHLWEAYSTFRKLRDVVKSYLEKLAQGDLQTFWNVSLSETWEETGEVAEPHAIKARAEKYAAQVPQGALYLTAGVDMQTDRLELETVGWGLSEESWSIEYKVFYGDPLAPEVWNELDEYLRDSRFVREDGAELKIESTCVDTGGTAGYTQAAYDWLRSKRQRRIFAIKGVPGFDKPIVSQPLHKQSGKDARKVDLYNVGVDAAKLVLMRRLQLTKPGSPGYCHFPDDREDEYYEQLTAEKLVTRKVKGFAKREWHQTRERNEALDCRIYAHAALKLLNPDLKRKHAKAQQAAAELQVELAREKMKAGLEQLPAEVRVEVKEAASKALEAIQTPQQSVAIQPKKRRLGRSSMAW